ncbi:MAG TPA: MerR family transcriptional regulator [Sphingomicrobium sp.]|nr:MerR family transcriptional regulator [Sphingomicrobium sp.]
MAGTATGEKAPGAFKTIGELSAELGVAQHILRYWESKFPQLKPLQRAGNRRYYRPGDVDLARRINKLLNDEGYTIRGVQKLLRQDGGGAEDGPTQTAVQPAERDSPRPPVDRLIAIRDRLASALES